MAHFGSYTANAFKPLSPRKSAVVSVLDVGTSKV